MVIGLALLAAVMAPVYAVPVGAASGPSISASLEGRPIPAVEVGRYACHDFDFPRIHCYRTRAELERAVADRLAAQSASGLDGPVGATATGYVKVYPDRGLQGLPAVLSVRYDDLSVIGWNDRISSFEGLAGVGGTFYQHIYLTGAAYPFSAYQIVTYVGDAYNDTFSSVRPK